jgi:hypothetical protein
MHSKVAALKKIKDNGAVTNTLRASAATRKTAEHLQLLLSAFSVPARRNGRASGIQMDAA